MIKFKTVWPLKNNQVIDTLTPELQGARVVLRLPHMADYQNWHDARHRNEAFLKPFEPKWSKDALSKKSYKRRLLKQREEITSGRGAFFFIISKKNNEILGGINLNNIQYGAACFASIGYWMDKQEQGKGYMKEAINLIINHAFETLKLQRLNAACLPENEASAQLLLRMSFKEEGYAKKYLQIDGRWQDHRLFGLTVSDVK